MQTQFQSAGILIAILFVVAIIETFLPAQKNAGKKRLKHFLPNAALTIMTLGIYISLDVVAVLTAQAIDVYNLSLVKLEAPVLVMFAFSVLCLDFFTYVAHRLMHVLPWMWRAHKIHHSDMIVDVTTAYRQHPFEGVWRVIFTVVPAWIFGIGPEYLVAYRVLSASFAILEHVNIRLFGPFDRAISTLIVTPDFHKVHHSRMNSETDTNYGNIFSIFDRLLNTYTPPRHPNEIEYGLDDTDDPRKQSLFGLLKMPFAKKSTS